MPNLQLHGGLNLDAPRWFRWVTACSGQWSSHPITGQWGQGIGRPLQRRGGQVSFLDALIGLLYLATDACWRCMPGTRHLIAYRHQYRLTRQVLPNMVCCRVPALFVCLQVLRKVQCLQVCVNHHRYRPVAGDAGGAPSTRTAATVHDRVVHLNLEPSRPSMEVVDKNEHLYYIQQCSF